MNLEFKPIDVEAIEELTPYFVKDRIKHATV